MTQGWLSHTPSVLKSSHQRRDPGSKREGVNLCACRQGSKTGGMGSGRRDKGMGEKSPPSDCMSKALDPAGSGTEDQRPRRLGQLCCREESPLRG